MNRILAKHANKLALLLLCCSLCSLQDKTTAYAAVKIDGCTIEDAFTPSEDETTVYYLNNSNKPYTLVANKVQELWVGEHHRFTVAANKREKVKISWSSSNPKVAKIVKTTGELTALSAGKTVIRMKDSANGVVKKFTLTVKPVPVLPEIPEEWYFVEDYDDTCAEWKRVYPEGMSEEACYSWESISGVKLVFREEYRDLYGQCSMLRLPEEINGKRVVDLWIENFDKGQWYTMYTWGFLNLKILQGPMNAVWWTYDINVKDPEAGIREMLYPSDAIVLDTAASSRAERLHIPESVVMLADGAWWGSKIYQIRIPAGVKVVGRGERDGGEYEGEGLAGGYFCVDGNNTNYYSIFGVLFSYPIHAKRENWDEECKWIAVRGCDTEIGKNMLIKYPKENTFSAYRVPDGVEKIARDAFNGAKFLKKIVLPDSVTELGMNAFARIQNDVEIVVPASVTVFDDAGGGTPFGAYPIEPDDPHASEKWNHITIVTPKGSAAEAYAIKYQIKYRNE